MEPHTVRSDHTGTVHRCNEPGPKRITLGAGAAGGEGSLSSRKGQWDGSTRDHWEA